MMQNERIDGGKAFDWGRASSDYAKYRDIYPEEFYQYLLRHDLCTAGQSVLDLGTGTGVLPRNLYPHGAKFCGVDSSQNQIEQARLLAQRGNMDIPFFCVPAEEIAFPDGSFDLVTACQCFVYFKHAVLAPKISRVLKAAGKFVVLYMAWLPYEDKIAGQSESLVLKYNPSWTGCGEKRHVIEVPELYRQYFEIERQDVFDVRVPFSRESWNGRIKACRGIGASLSEQETASFEEEHRTLLSGSAPEEFEILHYVAATVLKKI